MPLLLASLFAAKALRPDAFDDEANLRLVATALAELPLCLLEGLFAAALTLPGPTWRRRLIFVGIVVFVLALGGMWPLLQDEWLGPVLAWSLVGHALALAPLGAEHELEAARADAIAHDAADQVVLGGWSLVLGAAILLACWLPAGGSVEDAPWFLLALIGSLHFSLRAASIVYARRERFSVDRRRLLDRGWIQWLVRNLGRSGQRGYGD